MYIRVFLNLVGGIWILGSLAVQAQPDPLFQKKLNAHSLSERWELDSVTKRGVFLITPYKPVYITAGRWSDKPNEQPFSENPAYSLPFRVDYGNYEAKYQLSFKVKLLQEIFGKHGDLWIAYTQRSHWQIYNTEFSRPFRETNYEPEVLLNFATNFSLLGFKLRMMGIGLNHQSNGRALPLSRSWNRVIAHAAFERGKWVLLIRPWYRLKDTDDENPAITDYIGRADATLTYNAGRNLFALTSSHSLRLGRKNRGQLLFDWTCRIRNYLRGHMQLMHGYGETLVDYNHRQTTIGLGISLVEWL
ncbi:phospholipase A [Rhodocytophaga aerolata]|uniref:Phosphatidylcholine 1-acylhydrolase n=1 Tax=Rhodocytophaga aerolata TaxID=455078 RepID=A0ABT8R778_9BACT|nr:phospholipase A [Rhodocytophaga aerolata]MDO1447963.1 phospholipase A [Rhodocytophaga aerolata]